MLFEQATDINFYFGGAINKSNVELGITEKRKNRQQKNLWSICRMQERM